MNGHHHLHIRKRISKKALEPYPARTSWKRILDRFMLSVGIFAPVVTVPQILLIYSERDASGVSPATFFMLMVFNILWFVYSVAHREVPLMVLYALWVACNALIFIGALLYG